MDPTYDPPSGSTNPSAAPGAGEIQPDARLAAIEFAHDISANLMAKADAGARLFFALYHRPQAAELFESEFMSKGLRMAYMAAAEAFIPRGQS